MAYLSSVAGAAAEGSALREEREAIMGGLQTQLQQLAYAAALCSSWTRKTAGRSGTGSTARMVEASSK